MVTPVEEALARLFWDAFVVERAKHGVAVQTYNEYVKYDASLNRKKDSIPLSILAGLRHVEDHSYMNLIPAASNFGDKPQVRPNTDLTKEQQLEQFRARFTSVKSIRDV